MIEPSIRRPRRGWVWLGLLVAVLAGCTEDPREGAGPEAGPGAGTAAVAGGGEGAASGSGGGIVLTDVTAESGVGFVHDSGASGDRYLPETMGSGLAIFDADGDGRPDLFFVEGGAVRAEPGEERRYGALYLNDGEGRFAEVGGGEAGLTWTYEGVSGGAAPFLGMGAAVGDADGDGRLDLLITGVGGERLFLNRGLPPGRAAFKDVTDEWGLGRKGFSTSAAFLDLEGDGRQDLFVGRYVTWSPASDLPCRPDGVHRSYCIPEAYLGAASRLYRNRDGKRFEDVTLEAGLQRTDGKTLGVAVLDLGGDFLPDLAVANDTARNFLFRNLGAAPGGDGRFEEIALPAGIALGPSGTPRGAMGIDAGDLDGDGRPDLVIGNFAQEMASVYRQREGELFVDEAAAVGVGLPTLMRLAFGALAVELDGDGWLDLVFANGHIEPEIARFQPGQEYAQPLSVFRNLGANAGFEGVEPFGGDSPAPQPLWVGRGLAAGDLDGDGDLDLVMTQNGGPAVVLRNDSPRRPTLRLAPGSPAGGPAYGAKVEVETAGRTLHRWLTSGSSYLSAGEPVVTVGLGSEELQRVRILWPGGEELEVEADRLRREGPDAFAGRVHGFSPP